jgi:hypothetical protein
MRTDLEIIYNKNRNMWEVWETVEEHPLKHLFVNKELIFDCRLKEQIDLWCNINGVEDERFNW